MRLYPLQKRNYDSIDPIIREWASDNSLQLYTEHKDVEVRSVWFCDETGDVKFQIWIDPVDEDGAVGVHINEVKRFVQERKKGLPARFSVSETELRDTLDKALNTVKSKLEE